MESLHYTADWILFDYRLNTFWLQIEYFLTTDWIIFECRLNTFWLQIECFLTADWIHFDCRLNTFWLQIEYFLTIDWMLFDCRLNTFWLQIRSMQIQCKFDENDALYFLTKLNAFKVYHSAFNPVSSIYIWSEIFWSLSEDKYGGQWRP